MDTNTPPDEKLPLFDRIFAMGFFGFLGAIFGVIMGVVTGSWATAKDYFFALLTRQPTPDVERSLALSIIIGIAVFTLLGIWLGWDLTGRRKKKRRVRSS